MEKSKYRFRCVLLKTGGVSKASCSTALRIFILGMAQSPFIVEELSEKRTFFLHSSKLAIMIAQATRKLNQINNTSLLPGI
jgi:hypothetical protein